jgi:hypothetical protein
MKEREPNRDLISKVWSTLVETSRGVFYGFIHLFTGVNKNVKTGN